jgi:hypothetical protein|tara:strand:- start:13573 stop:15300 length:1728 start_codon:yes stop_codon:yes gene_type:complete
MGQTALKEEELLEIEEVPEGGIGDFAMSDEEFSVLEKEEAESQVGTEGIGNVLEFTGVSKRMASLGRYGDDMVVHVETGELVVPRRLIEQSPELKESIFKHLREQGITDPERYVVGSSENSINPDTGLMEFGFFSKLFKSVKKVFKKVGKALKKVAGIVLPIVGTMMFGPIWGAAIGSGIATLIQGGDLKDAFKSALTGAALGAVSTGISGALTKGSTAMGNISSAAKFSNVTKGFTNVGNALTGAGDVFGADGAISFDNMRAGPQGVEDALLSAADVNTAALETSVNAEAIVSDTVGGAVDNTGAVIDQLSGKAAPPSAFEQSIASLEQTPPPGAESGFFDKVGDVMKRGGDTQAVVDAAKRKAGEDMATSLLKSQLPADVQKAMIEKAMAGAGPGMLTRFGPTALAGTALAGATGMFEVPPMEDLNLVDTNPDGSMVTGSDIVDRNKEKYMLADLGSNIYDPYNVGPADAVEAEEEEIEESGYGYDPLNPDSVFDRPYVTAADGGAIFPRRNGGIMPDEGVPDEDSVRAMLMPGEFVMTTDAVKGLGNGNAKKGIQNMYDVMRNLERRGRAMA